MTNINQCVGVILLNISGPNKRKSKKMKTKTRILSIDGGGIKGIVPAVVLKYLEKYLKQLSNNPDARIVDYFDLFSGASTGAIIIGGLLSPDHQDRPKYTAEEIIELYIENGHVIFNASVFQEIKSVSGLVNVKYDPKGIESVFEEYFGLSLIHI